MALAAAETDERWALCPPVVDSRAPALPPYEPATPGTTQASANEVFAEADQVTRLLGDVVIQRDQATLLGDQAEYYRSEDRLLLQGHISYRGDALEIEGEQAKFMLEAQRGSFEQARFYLPGTHGFGSAARIEVDDPRHLRLEELRYTTCNPGQTDWELKASELSLDQSSNTGEARHATLSFKGVPFFYSPYLNFPLEGRKSGLLPPTYGTSERDGTDISLPVYWNIAPNQDATLTPRSISRRGPMLTGEYRFLTQNSRGQLNGSYLDDDKLFGDDRSYFSLQHSARLSAGWHSALTYRRTSDSEFFLDDLADVDESSNQTHLERRAELQYNDRYWQFLARAQDYQTLSGTAPYQRLPQLQLQGQSPNRLNQLRYGLESEAVRFRHETLTPTADRVDLKPSLSLPLGGPAWFLTPKAAWRHTQYQVDDGADTEQQLERSLPIASLDGGLFFERSLKAGDTPLRQTLEPRLFYLKVPYENQDELPLFDTGSPDFSFSQMFSDNRFSGADRQGDADQLTVALTSRLLDERSGRERARAAIGQIHYFEDRRVTLTSGSEAETRTTSDIIGELSLSPIDALNFRVTEQWNPELEQVERLNTQLRYSPGQRKIISMGYRYNREDALEQADVALFWPVARQWRMIGRYQYDLENEISLDTIGGLEYESCCWSVQLLARAQRDTVDDELNHSVYLTLELKGLASLGRGLDETIERGILGYD
ncbi:MAG: LPS assembly protein LptD [Gammaproteobacteria bacterium]|nr:LPS assembly protein LptD [Gammaproteobacteria bacterium]MCW8994005.1 LPS assembly protein LptD [Gammaproteobacteria bacterium]